MIPQLKLFADPNLLSQVHANILIRLMEDYKEELPPEAAALLLSALREGRVPHAYASLRILTLNFFQFRLLVRAHGLQYLCPSVFIRDTFWSQLWRLSPQPFHPLEPQTFRVDS